VKAPNVGDIVTVLDHGHAARAKVARSYKRRFIVGIEITEVSYVIVGNSIRTEPKSWTVHESFERRDEGRKWVRGWDTEDAIVFRAEKALEACR
jgi:hypothetical protein